MLELIGLLGFFLFALLPEFCMKEIVRFLLGFSCGELVSFWNGRTVCLLEIIFLGGLGTYVKTRQVRVSLSHEGFHEKHVFIYGSPF